MQVEFSPDEEARYARQVALPELGEAGQDRLRHGRVLVVGVGGLGSPALFYLAAAGVGTLGLMDADRVDLGNLQRQILHTTADVGRLKVESAAAKLRALNPNVDIQPLAERFTAANAAARLAGYDFVIDATDHVPSKRLIAEACHAATKPYCHAGVSRCRGQLLTVLPGRTTCLHCLFEADPEEPGPPVGPLGVVPGVLGVLQAGEAIRWLTGLGELSTDRVLFVDTATCRFRSIPVRRNPQCRLCGGQQRT